MVLMKRLVDDFLDWADRPKDGPRAIIVLICVSMVHLNVPESIVFKRVANDLDIAVVKIEIVASILWHVGSNRDRVFVGAEHQEISLDLPAQFWSLSLYSLAELSLLVLSDHLLLI